MKANMNTANRVIRAVIGLAIIGAGIYYKNWFGAIGIIPILSSAIGYCPLCCTKGGSCEIKKEGNHTEDKHEHKHGAGLGWQSLVGAELIVASSGVGYLMVQGQSNVSTTTVISGMIAIGIVGALIDVALRAFERSVRRSRGLE